MIDCLILGDSIAVGTHRFKQECHFVAKGGINTWQFNKNYPREFISDIVVISLGSNDHQGVKTRKELESLRSRVSAKSKVYWILPAIKPHIQEIVRDIAEKNNDIILPILSLQKDGIHPSWAGYKDLAEKIK
jgi:lysophospholipase L1-like esterase